MGVWINLVHPLKRNVFFGCELQDWITMNLNLELGNTSEYIWSAVWANACHLLWSWRNKLTHDATFVLPWQPWKIAIKETKDYHAVNQQHILRPASRKTTRLIRWIPPNSDWLKLNTDGSCLSDCGLAGCGGLFRDSIGT